MNRSWRVLRHVVDFDDPDSPRSPRALSEWTELEPLEMNQAAHLPPTPQEVGQRYGEGRYLLVCGQSAVTLEIAARTIYEQKTVALDAPTNVGLPVTPVPA